MLNRPPRSAYFCPHPSASVCPPLQRTTGDFRPSSVSAAVVTGRRHLPLSSTHCWPQIQWNARIPLAITQKRLSTNDWVLSVLWLSTIVVVMVVVSFGVVWPVPPLKYVQEKDNRKDGTSSARVSCVLSLLHDRKQQTINLVSANTSDRPCFNGDSIHLINILDQPMENRWW